MEVNKLSPVDRGPRLRSSGDLRMQIPRGARYSQLASLLVWALFLYLAIPVDILVPPELRVIDMSPNPVSRTIKLTLMAASLIPILSQMNLAAQVIRRLNVFFILFVGLVPLSTAWSIWPEATIGRSISIVCVTFVCLSYCVSSWEDRRFQKIVRAIATALLLGSLLFGLLYPDLAIERGEGSLKGAWHGLTSQKNQLGQLSGLGVILWAAAWLDHEVKAVRAFVGLAASTTCLILSRSSTSLIATLLVIIFLILMMQSSASLRRYMPTIVVTFALLVAAYAFATLKIVPGLDAIISPVTSMTGKDVTFSNRSEIWDIVREQIATRPLLGSGYGAYWIGPVPWSPSNVFTARMYFYPTEAHNGYLEIVNDLGVLGMCCLLGYLAIYVRQALALMRFDRNQGILFLCLFFHQAVVNLSESAWLQINGTFMFVVMTLAVFSMSRALIEHRALARQRTVPATQPVPASGPGDVPPRKRRNALQALGSRSDQDDRAE